MTSAEMTQTLAIISQWVADGLHVYDPKDKNYMVGYTYALYEHDVIGFAVMDYLCDYARGYEHENT
jgi:hypothetical protein